MATQCLRVTVASDSLLSAEQMPGLPYRMDFVPSQDQSALIRSLGEADALVTRRVDITDALLTMAPRLRFLQQVGAGTDRIDMEAATRHGVTVMNTPAAPTEAVAEHAFLLMLSSLRGFIRQVDAVRQGGWSGPLEWQGREIGGSTIGIVGFGAIGRAIASRALAFNANVLVSARSIPSLTDPRIRFVDLPTLLSDSAITVLSVALTAETRGLIGRRELDMMKREALLVNVSRGAVVVEAELIAALAEGRLSGAALDTFEQEPLPVNSPLRGMGNVIATPHSAGASQQSRQRIWATITQNLRAFAAGQTLTRAVNHHALSRTTTE